MNISSLQTYEELEALKWQLAPPCELSEYELSDKTAEIIDVDLTAAIISLMVVPGKTPQRVIYLPKLERKLPTLPLVTPPKSCIEKAIKNDSLINKKVS